MLVLSRNVGETIQIGDEVEVQVLGINRGQIRIGISAPREIQIVRSELIGIPRRSSQQRQRCSRIIPSDNFDQ